MPTDAEKKTDLLNVLPTELKRDLLWRATGPGAYAAFRDMVRVQAARMLRTAPRKAPVHNVNEETAEEILAEHGEDADVETLIAALQRAKER